MNLPRILSAAVNSSIWSRLFAPVDIASLVFFRIAFGLIMLWEVLRYFDNKWIKFYWMDTTFHFTYWGFDWVRPWPGDGMYLHFFILGILAVCITIGLWYRFMAALFFLGFTFVFLLDKAKYLNHYYLICLISLLMIFMPANRAFSIDAWRNPDIRSETAPAWVVWILRFQIGVPYFFGGLSKLNGDWLRGEPMSGWLAARMDFPIIGHLFAERWIAYFFSYAGLLSDLLVVPLLLWSRTRSFAFFVILIFHLLNSRLFNIGIFPWFMIAATLIFFPPDWPRRILRFFWPSTTRKLQIEHTEISRSNLSQVIILVLLGIYVSFQILMPLRHFLYPGNVNWTEEGHRYSWHMKLRHKTTKIKFYATDPKTKKSWVVDQRYYLTPMQIHKMSKRPDMIHQFSQYLSNELTMPGYEQFEIHAYVVNSLNVRKPQLLIDPKVNLAAEERSLFPAKWIKPLKEPLPQNRQRNVDRLRNK